jgi:hypothetical protein
MDLSKEARDAVLAELKSAKVAGEIFRFDAGTYKGLVAYKAIELSNGALLTADTEKFNDVFQQEPIEGTKGEIKFTTRGTIVDEKLKTGR